MSDGTPRGPPSSRLRSSGAVPPASAGHLPMTTGPSSRWCSVVFQAASCSRRGRRAGRTFRHDRGDRVPGMSRAGSGHVKGGRVDTLPENQSQAPPRKHVVVASATSAVGISGVLRPVTARRRRKTACHRPVDACWAMACGKQANRSLGRAKQRVGKREIPRQQERNRDLPALRV